MQEQKTCIKGIEYKNLPTGFFDDVIFYKYFLSFSGFIDIEPHIEMWTRKGEIFYLNEKEFRDCHFERAIPFFAAMADKMAIERGSIRYFDWEQIPTGWKYRYDNFAKHCFMPDAVYEVYDKWMKAAAEELKPKKGEDIADKIVRFDFWRVLLVSAYWEVMGVNIDDSVKTYIRMDEKIHVYDEPYAGGRLYIDKITKEDIDKIKNAVVLEIEYTAKCEGLYRLIKIVIFFEEDPLLYMSYEFQRDFDHIDEDEFMDKFMNVINCDLGNKEAGYSFDNAPDGFTAFCIDDDKWKTYWIRDDLYQANYGNVIVPLMNLPKRINFHPTPVCACRENKKGYVNW